MAGVQISLFRNRNAEDEEYEVVAWTQGYTLPTIESLEWDNPGYSFAGWNEASDGSGTSYNAGEELPYDASVYAQWQSLTSKYLNGVGLARVWGKVKALVPTKTSDLQNDSGYLTINTLPVWDGGVT